jgi:hypothetical protein
MARLLALKPTNTATVAFASRAARIAWALMIRTEGYAGAT